MSRVTKLLFAIAFVIPIILIARHTGTALLAQAAGTSKTGTTGQEKAAPAAAKMTDAQKIADAMSAAPPGISLNATIMDWPDTPTGKPKQLRAGTNGWVCYPSMAEMHPGGAGDDPMCFDKSWQSWAEAWMNRTPPKVSTSGIAYMLKGDTGASNTDPFAMALTATNQWVVSPPHMMVLYPDTKMLDDFPIDPKNGGPWVMLKGTPYAHLMVPVSTTKAASMPAK
jgi:hypothetical protein